MSNGDKEGKVLKTLLIIILVITTITLVYLFVHDQRVQEQGETVAFAPTPRLVQQPVLTQSPTPATAQVVAGGTQAPGSATKHESLEMPGVVSGTGTHFEVTDDGQIEGGILNLVVDASSSVTLKLQSFAETFRMFLQPNPGSVMFTVSGLAPSATYYKYVGDYNNLETLTSDANGSTAFSVDTTDGAYVWFQLEPSTTYISLSDVGPSGECAQHYEWVETPAGSDNWVNTPMGVYYGTWTSATTCTLTSPVAETIQIDDSNITLDCANNDITGPGRWEWVDGVFIPAWVSEVTVLNCNIFNFASGIYAMGDRTTIIDNNLTNNWYSGIETPGNNNNVVGNTIKTDWSYYGIVVDAGTHNTFESNTITPEGYMRRGILLYGASHNTLQSNTITPTGRMILGIDLYGASHNTVDGNTLGNIVGNSIILFADAWNDVGANNNTITNNTIMSGAGITISGDYDYPFEPGSQVLSKNNIIKNNNITAVGHGVILTTFASDNSVEDNTLSITGAWWGGAQGIQMDSASDGNHLVHNNISLFGGTPGMMPGIITAGSWYAGVPAPSGNMIRNNDIVQTSGTGILLDGGEDTMVLDNRIKQNVLNGIKLGPSSSDNFIANNVITDSGENGVLIDSSSYNKVVHNTIEYCGTGFYGVNEQGTTTRNVITNNNLLACL